MTHPADQSSELQRIRIACATSMGWVWHGEKDWDQEPGAYYWRLGNMAYQQLPDYPRDSNAALQLVDALKEEGWDVFIERQGDGRWVCSFEKNELRRKIRIAYADTFAEAIARAFLKIKCPDLK